MVDDLVGDLLCQRTSLKQSILNFELIVQNMEAKDQTEFAHRCTYNTNLISGILLLAAILPILMSKIRVFYWYF